MRHKTAGIASPQDIDWKGIGYLFSIGGILLLGAHAWPKPSDPSWHLPALIIGVAVSIIGFGLRYMAHLKERREIAQAKAEAENADKPDVS